MLHIATPAFRYDYLDQIYESIPSYADIRWHIVKVADRPPLSHAFLADPRVRLYEIACPDADTITKRNHVFDHITDGYFHLLDDDTLFHPGMYRIYRQYTMKKLVGMVIGCQQNRDGYLYLQGQYPIHPLTTPTDAGMVLCHHSVLSHIRWASAEGCPNDFYFWQRCYAFFGQGATVLIPDVVSCYNYFGPQIRVRKKLLFWTLSINIYSSYIAWPYRKVSRMLNVLRKLAGIKKRQDNRFLKP